jgi:hypothetical protein
LAARDAQLETFMMRTSPGADELVVGIKARRNSALQLFCDARFVLSRSLWSMAFGA